MRFPFRPKASKKRGSLWYTVYIMGTLRTAATEARYQADKANGKTIPLDEEPSIMDWYYWRVIENRYPHDMEASVHHLLLPQRKFAKIEDATAKELAELYTILFDYLYNKYSAVKMNYPRQQSVHNHFHIHLLTYK